LIGESAVAIRTSRKAAVKPSLAPEPQPEVPQPAGPQSPRGRFSDWIALLIWLAGFGIIFTIVLADTVLGFLRHL
jgi:hypothetical protein